MMANNRIPVYERSARPASPPFRTSPTFARKLIDCRAARAINPNDLKVGIKLIIGESFVVVRELFSGHPFAFGSKQRIVYQNLATETHPRVFNGGLTRTEKKPAPFQKFKAARVSCTEV